MPFVKGKSGNPRGRASEKPFRDALMLAVMEAGKDGKNLRRLARSLVQQGLEGNVQAISAIADRLDGKPIQQQEIKADIAVSPLMINVPRS